MYASRLPRAVFGNTVVKTRTHDLLITSITVLPLGYRVTMEVSQNYGTYSNTETRPNVRLKAARRTIAAD